MIIQLIEQLGDILSFFWNYTFVAASDFLVQNGFGVLILTTLITGIIIDLLIEVLHIKD